MKLTKNDFVFIYSQYLFSYLYKEKHLTYICRGIHPTTFKPFVLFQKSDELQQALNEYKQKQLNK